jgi:RNA polymerase sigma-70 factor (ECF subfamily)
VQEALIALWRLQSAPVRLDRWMLHAVVHRSLHARRTRIRRIRWEHGAAEAAQAAEHCAFCDPERELETAEFWSCLDRIAATLCAEQRDVWLLRDRDGLEYEEIAQRLGVPLGTVRSRLHRARTQLRVRIASESADALPGRVRA